MISVVTITFNNFDELIETTNSIKGVVPIEHIVINGGKCPQTKNYLESDSNSVSVSEPDRGISDAFSKGARMAKGIGVVYLNSGDKYIGGDYYQEANDILEKNPEISFVHSNILFKDRLAGELLMKPAMESLGLGMPYMHPTLVVRKSVFEKIGYFSLDKKIAMDFDFVCRMKKNNCNGYYVDGPPVVLMDGTGVSATQEAKAIQECLESLKSNNLFTIVIAKDFYIRLLKYKIRRFLTKFFPSILIAIKKKKHTL